MIGISPEPGLASHREKARLNELNESGSQSSQSFGFTISAHGIPRTAIT